MSFKNGVFNSSVNGWSMVEGGWKILKDILRGGDLLREAKNLLNCFNIDELKLIFMRGVEILYIVHAGGSKFLIELVGLKIYAVSIEMWPPAVLKIYKRPTPYTDSLKRIKDATSYLYSFFFFFPYWEGLHRLQSKHTSSGDWTTRLSWWDLWKDAFESICRSL